MFEARMALDLSRASRSLDLRVGNGFPCSTETLLEWLEVLRALAPDARAFKAGEPVDMELLPRWLVAGDLEPRPGDLTPRPLDSLPHPFDCIVKVRLAGVDWESTFCQGAERHLEAQATRENPVPHDLEELVGALGRRLGDDVLLDGDVGTILRWRRDLSALEYLGLDQPTTCCQDLHAPARSPFSEVEGYGFYDGSTSGVHRCGTCGRLWFFERIADLTGTLDEVLLLAPCTATPPIDWEAAIAEPVDAVLAFTSLWFGSEARLSSILSDPAGRSWADIVEEATRVRGDSVHVHYRDGVFQDPRG